MPVKTAKEKLAEMLADPEAMQVLHKHQEKARKTNEKIREDSYVDPKTMQQVFTI